MGLLVINRMRHEIFIGLKQTYATVGIAVGGGVAGGTVVGATVVHPLTQEHGWHIHQIMHGIQGMQGMQFALKGLIKNN